MSLFRHVESHRGGGKIIQEPVVLTRLRQNLFQCAAKENATDYCSRPIPTCLLLKFSDEMRNTLKAENSGAARPAQAKVYGGIRLTALCRRTAHHTNARLPITLRRRRRRPPIRPWVANMILSDVAKTSSADETDIPIDPAHFAAIAQMSGDGRIKQRNLPQTGAGAVGERHRTPNRWVRGKGA